MPAQQSQPLRAEYHKHWFVVGTVAALSATAYGAYSYYIAIEDVTRGFWLVAEAILVLMLVLFLVPPILTAHLLGEKGLGIRMGLLIDATVPYEWISEVRETSISRGGLSVGVGVRYSRIMKTVFVTSSFRGLVEVKLRQEHPVGRGFRPKVDQIVLNVRDRDAFMKTLAERLGAREDG